MIIIPDVHGRTFWKRAVKHAKGDEKIVFLGDYLDPYYDIMSGEEITPKSAFLNFKEIMAFKQLRPEQVVLLLGNHDTEYFLGTYACRQDEFRMEEIEQLFIENRSLFQLGYYTEINGQKYTFSHTCITEYWVKQSEVLVGCKSPQEVIDTVGKMDDVSLGRILDQVGYSRNGDFEYGSMIWASVDEAQDLGWEGDTTYQVFGHTQQLKDPLFFDRFAMLDCRKAFRLNESSSDDDIENRFEVI